MDPSAQIKRSLMMDRIRRTICPLSCQGFQNAKSVPTRPVLRWAKVKPHDVHIYHEHLRAAVSSGESSLASLPCHGRCHCSDGNCKIQLQQEYDSLFHALKFADSFLPRHQQTGRENDWWTEELSDIKRQSIAIQNLWIAEGRPSQGPTSLERRRVRAAYKRAIRNAQRAPKQESWDRIHTALESCDTNQFWHSWKTLHCKNKGGSSPMVDGSMSEPAIANSFKNAFQRNSRPNNQSRDDDPNAKFND